MIEACREHGGYEKSCENCRALTQYQPVEPGDFICMMIVREDFYTDRSKFHRYDFSYGQVRGVTDKGLVTGYTDHAGTSRIMRSSIERSWGVMASLLRADEFWGDYRMLIDPMFRSFGEAQDFARYYLVPSNVVTAP